MGNDSKLFKSGDEVICEDDEWTDGCLSKGQSYVVETVVPDFWDDMLILEGQEDVHWRSDRFVVKDSR